MFDYISGKIAAVGDNRVIIDCGGVGFSLTASNYTVAECSRKEFARLPVYLAVRDDALELFGFADEKERDLFMLLIGVSGVGPKLAVTVLGGMDIKRLASAIANSDTAALSAVKGVGKKTAERIALELKGKIDISYGADIAQESPVSIDAEAVQALINLGYDKKEAESTVKRVAKPDMSTEDVIRAALMG